MTGKSASDFFGHLACATTTNGASLGRSLGTASTLSTLPHAIRAEAFGRNDRVPSILRERNTVKL